MFGLFRKTKLRYTDSLGETTNIVVKPDESVLDALLNSGHDVTYSCRSGVCQSCVLKTTTPAVLPPESQRGLKSTQVDQGYFLACSCLPKKNLEIINPAPSETTSVSQVISKDFLSDNVIRLRLTAPFNFSAGQFCNLFKAEDLFRSYSIASIPKDGFLEFHIKCIENGAFSSWAATDLSPGDEIKIQGPFGDCIYSESAKTKPLLLTGIGTGLAPLLGIIKDALDKNHAAPITLILGAREERGFYLYDDLRTLSQQHNNVTIHWLVSELSNRTPKENMQVQDIYNFVKDSIAPLDDHNAYLCGAPTFVQKMKKQCFLSGASMSAIFSDSFIPSH